MNVDKNNYIYIHAYRKRYRVSLFICVLLESGRVSDIENSELEDIKTEILRSNFKRLLNESYNNIGGKYEIS